MWNKSTDKNYFFDVFNQYSISNTWEIKTTSPENKALDNGENIYSRWDDINPLYKKFLKDKKEIYSKKEENKLRQSRIWKDKDYWNVWGYYTWFISDKVIDEKKCKSMVPCYHQAEVSYPPKRVSEEKKWATRWDSWCVPTAWSMIYGYYDMNWFSDLIDDWDNHIINDSKVNTLQKRLWEFMNTKLKKDWWATTFQESLYWTKYLDEKRIPYERGRFYSKDDWVLWKIQNEIKAKRPLFYAITWHAIVVYWFHWDNLFANYWWGLILDLCIWM